MEVTPLTPEEIILLAESSDGKETKSQNNWAANRWKTWAAARNEQFKAGGIRMLEDLKKVPLDNTEIKDTEGLPYEGKTFHTLVMAANRVCVAAHGEEGNFMGNPTKKLACTGYTFWVNHYLEIVFSKISVVNPPPPPPLNSSSNCP